MLVYGPKKTRNSYCRDGAFFIVIGANQFHFKQILLYRKLFYDTAMSTFYQLPLNSVSGPTTEWENLIDRDIGTRGQLHFKYFFRKSTTNGRLAQNSYIFKVKNERPITVLRMDLDEQLSKKWNILVTNSTTIERGELIDSYPSFLQTGTKDQPSINYEAIDTQLFLAPTLDNVFNQGLEFFKYKGKLIAVFCNRNVGSVEKSYEYVKKGEHARMNNFINCVGVMALDDESVVKYNWFLQETPFSVPSYGFKWIAENSAVKYILKNILKTLICLPRQINSREL